MIITITHDTEITAAATKERQRTCATLPGYMELEGCWKPPATAALDDDNDNNDSEHSYLLASSNVWKEALAIRIQDDLVIQYGEGVARASPSKHNGLVWIDLDARVLVGWHGSVQPPHGMDPSYCLLPTNTTTASTSLPTIISSWEFFLELRKKKEVEKVANVERMHAERVKRAKVSAMLKESKKAALEATH